MIHLRCPRCLAVVDTFSETEASRPERVLIEAERWGLVALRSHTCREPL